MARRMTYEEKQAAREKKNMEAALEQQRREITAFRKKIDDERTKQVYTGSTAYELAGDTDEQHRRVVYALEGLVREFTRIKGDLRKHVARMQERMTDALRRLDEGRTGTGYSTMLGDLPADIEQCNAKLDALTSGIAQLAWATNWHVPHIHSVKHNEHRALLVSINVEQPSLSLDSAGLGGYYVVSSKRDDGTTWYLATVDNAETLVINDVVNLPFVRMFQTEDAAWLAAMTFVGDGRWL